MDVNGNGNSIEPANPAELESQNPSLQRGLLEGKTFEQAIELLKALVDTAMPGTRHGSLVKTKLEEANHWWLAGKGVL